MATQGQRVVMITGAAGNLGRAVADAFAERLWPTWALACAQSRRRIPVLFTAHSVPCRTIMTGEASIEGARPGTPIQETPDPYPVEAKRTAQLVADRLAQRQELWRGYAAPSWACRWLRVAA